MEAFYPQKKSKLNQPGARLQEFDALRGFSIILVVFAHALMFCKASNCISGQIFHTFRMPLFFFVSGFFAYRAQQKWDSGLYKRIFQSKIKAQIICPIVFFALLYYSKGANPFEWIKSGFQEYWFTIALFQMFTLYALTNFISRLIHFDITLIAMLLLSILGMVILRIGTTDNLRICDILSTNNVCFFIQFFTLGLFVRKIESKAILLISNNYVKAFVIMAFVCLLCFSKSDQYGDNELINKFVGLIISYCGVLLMLALFYSASNYWNSKSTISKWLCFTGRRTLDIYMLHYFFLPTLPVAGEWIMPNSMFLFQLLVPGGIALTITILCLIISNGIRISPLLAQWLFGARQREKSTK